MRVVSYLIIFQLTLQSFVFGQKKTTWDVYDQHFNKLTQIRASNVSIHNQLVWYKKGKLFGVADLQGRVVIKPKYETIAHYPAGLTAAGINGCFTMVHNGKEILPPEYNRFFRVDSIGYFTANRGCSDRVDAYTITTASIHDLTGKIISKGCDDDIRAMFLSLTKRADKTSYSRKDVDNGFSIRLIQSDERYVRKGIYNRRDSLIFSCTRCTITNNINGRFFIFEHGGTQGPNAAYVIDTTGAVILRRNYETLMYDVANERYFYRRGKEHGIVSKGHETFLDESPTAFMIKPVSANRLLLSVSDRRGKSVRRIYDSTGQAVFMPDKGYLRLAGHNALIWNSPDGYFFLDGDGKIVSERYDSIYNVPEFRFREMVLGERLVGFVRDVVRTSPLDRDGNLPITNFPAWSYYIIERDGRKGLFNVKTNQVVAPQFDLVAQADDGQFALRKGREWFALTKAGKLKSFGKNRYINFFENYIVVGR